MDLYAHSTIRLHGVLFKAAAKFKVHNTARFDVLTAVLSDCLALEKKGSAVFRNVGHYTPKDTASHPSRLESSSVTNTVGLNEISKCYMVGHVERVGKCIKFPSAKVETKEKLFHRCIILKCVL